MPTVDVEHKLTTLEKAVKNVKDHVKKHQMIYSLGAGSVLTTTVFVLSRRFAGSVQIAPVFNNVNQQVNLGGYTTKFVKCIETGQVWEKVIDAADAVGVNRTVMSKHLNGHSADHLFGKHYKIVGIGTTG